MLYTCAPVDMHVRILCSYVTNGGISIKCKESLCINTLIVSP